MSRLLNYTEELGISKSRVGRLHEALDALSDGDARDILSRMVSLAILKVDYLDDYGMEFSGGMAAEKCAIFRVLEHELMLAGAYPMKDLVDV